MLNHVMTVSVKKDNDKYYLLMSSKALYSELVVDELPEAFTDKMVGHIKEHEIEILKRTQSLKGIKRETNDTEETHTRS